VAHSTGLRDVGRVHWAPGICTGKDGVRPVTITAGGSQRVTLHQKSLAVVTDKEHLLRNRLQGELPHPWKVPMAGEAEANSLDLVQRACEASQVSLFSHELSGVPPVAIRTEDSATGMDPVQKPQPHIGMAHDAGVFLHQVSGHCLLGVTRTRRKH
jgi:hypothetical protein